MQQQLLQTKTLQYKTRTETYMHRCDHHLW